MEKYKIMNEKIVKKQTNVFLLTVTTSKIIKKFSNELFFNYKPSFQESVGRKFCKNLDYSCKAMNQDSIPAINNSFVMKLAYAILKNCLTNTIDINSNTIINNSFYNNCIKSLSSFSNDVDLLKLSLKQMALIFKNNLKLYNLAKYNLQNNFILKNKTLYLKILETFWSKTDWSRLFPSMPEAALHIHNNKKLLISLMLKKDGEFRIDDIVNSFIKHSKYITKHNLLFISFVDFSILSWFEHFGILNYTKGNFNEPVFVSLTGHGRKILKYLALN